MAGDQAQRCCTKPQHSWTWKGEGVHPVHILKFSKVPQSVVSDRIWQYSQVGYCFSELSAFE